MAKDETKRTKIGGQALFEGLMMKGPDKTCTAVRKPDGEIFLEVTPTLANPVGKFLFVRGIVSMIQNFKEGYERISRSAEIALPEDEQPESKFDQWIEKHTGPRFYRIFSIAAMVVGLVLGVVLFMLVPIWLVNGIEMIPGVQLGIFRATAEGLIKIAVFLAYLLAVTRIKDIHRVFEYHGAEHKTITCYEQGDELTIENIRRHSRFHPRCGTSFIFIVLIVSILIFSFVSWGNPLLRMCIKILLLPLVVGISYEIIMYASMHRNLFCRILSAPGLWVQRLTTFEPDDDQIEVALTAFQAVLPDDGRDLL